VQAERFFHAHGAWTVFIARFVTGLRVFAGPLAGALGMPWLKFLFYNFSGAVVWSVAISMVGYFFGSQWPLLLKLLKRVNLGILVVAVLALYLAWRRHRKRHAVLEEAEAAKSVEPAAVAADGADERG
jgi:membrane-associated protein